jgi:hypothetical protein
MGNTLCLNLKQLLLITISLFSATVANSWPIDLEVGGESLLSPREICVTSNGTVVVSTSGPFEDPVIICLDPSGETICRKTIFPKGGTSRSFESGAHLVPMETGFAISLHSEPRATGINTDVAVARLDSSGDTLWTFVLGLEDELNWACTDIIRCSDEGLLITGCPGFMLPGGYLFRIGTDGRLDWITPTDVFEEYVLSAVEMPDGSFLCLTDGYTGDLTLRRVSGTGEILPAEIIDTDVFEHARSIFRIGDEVWILSAEGNVINGAKVDECCSLSRTFSILFPPEVTLRSLEPAGDSILVSGGFDGTGGYVAMIDVHGSILMDDTVSTFNQYPFVDSAVSDGVIYAMTSAQVFRLAD